MSPNIEGDGRTGKSMLAEAILSRGRGTGRGGGKPSPVWSTGRLSIKMSLPRGLTTMPGLVNTTRSTLERLLPLLRRCLTKLVLYPRMCVFLRRGIFLPNARRKSSTCSLPGAACRTFPKSSRFRPIRSRPTCAISMQNWTCTIAKSCSTCSIAVILHARRE